MNEIVVAHGALAVITDEIIEPHLSSFVVAQRCAALVTRLPAAVDLRSARIVRDKLTPDLESICAASRDLTDMVSDHLLHAVEKGDALRLLGRLYAVFSKRTGTADVAALLAESAAMLTEDTAILRAIGLKPPPRHRAIVALACKKVIAERTFAPAPCELRQALFEVRDKIVVLRIDVHSVLKRAREVERLVFKQDRQEWRQPYASGAVSRTVADYLSDCDDAEWQRAVDDLFDDGESA